MLPPSVDVVVIGGGQSALAVGYYLRRSGLSFVLLDEQSEPGGAWPQAWPSLRLFSPAQWSSLPGWLMPRGDDEYPTRDGAIAYLTEYERRYSLPVERPVRVSAVHRESDTTGLLRVETDSGSVRSRAVVSATGNWANPSIPDIPDRSLFAGDVLHSSQYRGPSDFIGRHVIVVGGGNSGAQIVAELSAITRVTWATLRPPTILPDEIDGRYLFEQATARYRAIQEGRTPDPPRSLEDIVAVASVREARDRGALETVRMFERFTRTGVVDADGVDQPADAVIFATGFRPALEHLKPLGVMDAGGRVEVRGTRSVAEPRLWLVGYGEWTGFASATLIGVGRSARATVQEIAETLAPQAETDR